MLHAGALRHRITLEQLQAELDSDDGITAESWAAFASMIPAEITPLSGRELIAAQAVQSKVTTRIRIRWRDGVLPSMRVLHREQVFNIEAAVPDAASGREWLTLFCHTGPDEG
jgi:SPP1 family predicted phage head-tail adaptor